MENENELVSLDNLGWGAARELFQDNLERVVENILDPNMSDTEKRTITLKLTITPNAGNREFCTVNISCDAKLALARDFPKNFIVGKKAGRYLAAEYNPQQQKLFTPDEPVKLHKREGGAND